MNLLLLILSLTLCILIAYAAGRADILRRIWRRVSGRERVKLTLKRIVRETEPYPRFYGRAYRDWSEEEVIFIKVAYPVPLNLIVRGVRSLSYRVQNWLRFPKPSWLEKRMEKVYFKGVDSGASYDKGHNDGFADGRTILLSDLTKEVERILSEGVDPQPDTISATLINAIRDKANDDNPPA